MNIVITGIDGTRNRGVEALVVSSIEQLKSRLPDLNITVITKTPDYDKVRLTSFQNVSLVENRPSKRVHTTLRESVKQKLSAISPFHKLQSRETSHQERIIQESSLVIASGGDLFSSDYGGCYVHLQPLEIALSAGIPVVFLAQSIGPFKTDKEAEAWLKVARMSKLVTVRENLSYKYVTEDLGLSDELVKQTADPAFLLTPIPDQQVASILTSYGITRDKPIISLAVSRGISRYAQCDYEEHVETWCKIIAMLLDKIDAQIILIPHVQDIRPHNDDRILATTLLRSLDFDSRIRIFGADHSASEFKGLIGACDMVVAERMHAAIAGLSSGVCTVAVGYSVKAEGIISDLSGASMQKSDFLVPFEDFLNAELAFPKLIRAWEKRREVANHLSSVLSHVRENAMLSFDLIASSISEHKF